MEQVPYKILVISSCTAEKLHKPSGMLVMEDFIDPKLMAEKEQFLQQYATPAAKMYTGTQHLRLLEGIKSIRRKYGKDSIDFKIISAGYGLIDEDDNILPYEVTFNEMNSKENSSWAKSLNIKENLSAVIKDYHIIFFILGEKYLRALQLPIPTEDWQKLIFLAAPTSSSLIPDIDNHYVIPVTSADASQFSYGLIGLKGYMFKLLGKELMDTPELFKEIYEDPNVILYRLRKHRKDYSAQTSFFGEEMETTYNEFILNQQKQMDGRKRMFVGFRVRSNEFAANYRAGKQIKYFIPEWDDRVDPQYDFVCDQHHRTDAVHKHDVYAHEIYRKPNYDGVLISLALLNKGIKRDRVSEKGVHDFIRLPKEYPLMGDCGAFDYIHSEYPPFTTEQALESYQKMGFDYGVSIDHLIVGPFKDNTEIRNMRYKLTQENAVEFIKKHREGNFSYKPIGVAQGWDPSSYYDSVKLLVELGYEYIAIGSLIPKKSQEIYQIMKIVAPLIPEYMDVHLFGIARSEGIQAYYQLGATSFDSAGPLRRAWLGAGHNYFTLEEDPNSDIYLGDGYKKYSAIRIPFVNTRDLTEDVVKKLKVLENNALESLRLLERNQISIDTALNAILIYEQVSREEDIRKSINYKTDELQSLDEEGVKKKLQGVNKTMKIHSELYREVLEKRPWEKCDCDICKGIGIEVIIFRGNNRNRRRGFHNTYVFNKQFRNAIKIN